MFAETKGIVFRNLLLCHKAFSACKFNPNETFEQSDILELPGDCDATLLFGFYYVLQKLSQYLIKREMQQAASKRAPFCQRLRFHGDRTGVEVSSCAGIDRN